MRAATPTHSRIGGPPHQPQRIRRKRHGTCPLISSSDLTSPAAQDHAMCYFYHFCDAYNQSPRAYTAMGGANTPSGRDVIEAVSLL